jgi:chorismate mutase
MTSLMQAVASMGLDPIIQQHREQIAELDLQILEALNQRTLLVKRLKDYKEAHGFGFHDAAQEGRVISNLRQTNRGPLSNKGLQALFKAIIEWTKRDAAALGDARPD